LQFAVLEGLAVFLPGLFQGLDVLGLGAQGEQLHDQTFEHAAQFIDVDGIGQGDDRHLGPLGIGEFHQAFGLQVTQGFAHRGTADAEAVAQVALHQAVTRQQLEVHDGAAQFLQHDFAQGDRVVIDLEAVVEGQAFHGGCSEWGG